MKASRQFIRQASPRVRLGLRVQLILVFVGCIVAASVIATVVANVDARSHRTNQIDYTLGVADMEGAGLKLAKRLGEPASPADGRGRSARRRDVQTLIEQLADRSGTVPLKVAVTDRDGIIVLRSARVPDARINIDEIIRSSTAVRTGIRNYVPGSEYATFFPVRVGGADGYLVVSGMPAARVSYNDHLSFAGLAAGVGSFFVLFFWLTGRRLQYVERLAQGLLVIAGGNLAHRVPEEGRDELSSLAQTVNFLATELQHRTEAERRAEATQRELITNVSHDLRTPLTSIKGYLHLLDSHGYASSEQQAQYIRIAYGKAEQLQYLVEELFEYTKLTGKGMPLHKASICLNAMIDQVVAEFVPVCEAHQMTLTNVAPQERIYVTVDPDKLARVFDNLLTNAVNYGYSPGEIRVSLTRTTDGVEVVVQNPGPTIPPEELPHLFDRFFRLERSRSSQTGGSGLGLAITRSIVELHGGSIRAESADGVVRFHVWLPHHVGSAAQGGSASARS